MRITSIYFNDLSKRDTKGIKLSAKGTNAPYFGIPTNNKLHLQSFGTNFLTKIDGVICPCCGIKMTTVERFDQYLKEKFLSGSSKDAVATLTRFEPNMHTTEARCFTILKKLSRQFPEKTLQELVIREVPKHLYHLQLRQLRVLDQIDIHLKELPEEIRAGIAKVSTEARSTINNETTDNLASNNTPFKRKVIINLIERFKDANPGIKKLQEIYRTSLRLPNSSNDVDSFFVKYSRRSSSEIGQRLVSKSKSTIEHIHPHSKDGKSEEKNYLAECAGCNNSRGSILLNDWIVMNPQMLKNLRLYMRQIVSLIQEGKIIQHDDYPDEVTRTIKEETLGNELKKPRRHRRFIGEFRRLYDDLILIKDETLYPKISA